MREESKLNLGYNLIVFITKCYDKLNFTALSIDIIYIYIIIIIIMIQREIIKAYYNDTINNYQERLLIIIS